MNRTTAFTICLVASSFLLTGCGWFLSLCAWLTTGEQVYETSPAAYVAVPAAEEGEPECALCAALGLDVNTDAALLGVGFVADGVFPAGLGAEVDVDYGQGSGEDDEEEFSYDPIAKTEGFGSDYSVLRASFHARYAVPVGSESDLTIVPLAGLGLYHWSLKDCEDPDDLGFCTWDTTTLDIGAEAKWNRFGFKLWLPASGGGPDFAFRVRYNLLTTRK